MLGRYFIVMANIVRNSYKQRQATTSPYDALQQTNINLFATGP